MDNIMPISATSPTDPKGIIVYPHFFSPQNEFAPQSLSWFIDQDQHSIIY
jgi:hypothetical protein